MTQTMAWTVGAAFLIAAIIGVVTTPLSMAGGLLLGLFPVNAVHNLVHLVFGGWGLAAGRTPAAARRYCRGAGIIYLALAVIGFVAPAGFGLVPIGGHDIWLHAILGGALLGTGLL
jgi:hypothetical protein